VIFHHSGKSQISRKNSRLRFTMKRMKLLFI